VLVSYSWQMMSLAAVGAAVTLVALVTSAADAEPAADEKPGLAVLGVVAKDASVAKAAGAMTAAIRRRASAKASAYRVIGTAKEIDRAQLAADCNAIDTTCATKLGAAFDARYTVAGELEQRGTHQVLVLALVDVGAKQRIRSVRETAGLKVDAKKLVRSAYVRLVEAEAGELALVANVERGEVMIDGALVAALFDGRTTITGLVNGTHQLSVRAKGYKPLDVDVTIDFATEQMVILEPVAE
jgi:hypothetical protein